jgi:Prophage CP4-57 regulatory protein (AlpA)
MATTMSSKPEVIPTLPSEGLIRISRLIGGDNPLLPVCRATLYNWIREGRVPAPTRIGARIVAYHVSTVRSMLLDLANGTSGDGEAR